MKLILEGATIVHEPSATGRLDDKMYDTHKWQVPAVRMVSVKMDAKFKTISSTSDDPVNAGTVNSVEDALKATAPRRGWLTCKRYHQIFTVARSQAQAV